MARVTPILGTNTANYMFDINGDHHFNALLGTEAIKYTYEGISAARKNYLFESDDYMHIDSGDPTTAT